VLESIVKTYATTPSYYAFAARLRKIEENAEKLDLNFIKTNPLICFYSNIFGKPANIIADIIRKELGLKEDGLEGGLFDGRN
jgi:hypothetical protein